MKVFFQIIGKSTVKRCNKNEKNIYLDISRDFGRILPESEITHFSFMQSQGPKKGSQNFNFNTSRFLGRTFRELPTVLT